MDIITFLIVGVALFCITVWIHRHTYFTVYEFGKGYVADLERPMELQVWMVIMVAIIALIPVINIAAFSAGVAGWVFSYGSDDIRLGNLPKWAKALLNFLNKQI